LVWDDPWYLRPIPAEGGECFLNPIPSGAQAEIDQMREQSMRKCQPFVAWWKSASSTYEQKLALVEKHYQNCSVSIPPYYRAKFAPAENMAKLASPL
jgi:hypothetical protein